MDINKIITIAICAIFLCNGCNNTTGTTTPEYATISGTITFTGEWPESGDILVSVNSNWLPEGMPPYFSPIIFSELSNDTYTYTFDNVNFDTYEAVTVSWQNPDDYYNSSCDQTTIGAYGGTAPWAEEYGQGTDPTPITTSTTNYELTLDVNVNLDYAIPNSFMVCQPICSSLSTQDECLEHGHCQWDTSDTCITKQ